MTPLNTSDGNSSGRLQIRLVCGEPCRRATTSLGAVVGQPPAVASLFEIRGKDDHIVRTTTPSQYLSSLGVDPKRDVSNMVEAAIWKWRAGEYGWYPTPSARVIPNSASQPPNVLIRKVSSRSAKDLLGGVARLLGGKNGNSSYEISLTRSPTGEIVTTQEPDVVLTQAGLNIWEASALISQADVSWSLLGKSYWHSSHGDRFRQPIDVSRLDPNEPLKTNCRIRVLAGFPPLKSYVLTSLDKYLDAGINFAVEYRNENGTIKQVRTQSPLTVLASIPGVDSFTAEQMCMNALWRWETKSFGWSRP